MAVAPPAPASFGAGAPKVRTGLRAVMLFAPGLALLIALLSYNPDDPSWSRASAHAPTNLLGLTGAYLADVLVQGLGLLAVAVPILALLWAWAALRNGRLARWRLRGAAAAFAILLASMAASCAAPDLAWPVSSGPGGLVGWLAARLATDALAPFAAPVWSLSILLGLIALPLLVWSADWPRPAPDDTPRDIDAPEPRAEAPVRRARKEPDVAPMPRTNVERSRVSAPSNAARPSQRAASEKQRSLELGDTYMLPPLNLLSGPARAERPAVDTVALEHNARLLETILDDYGVKGEIMQVRPGPVVTLYELEPAPGVKSSRVIGLTDDIARSMSAVSARVAVVPGRNVIGIELPNARRDSVSLRELLSSEAFEGGKRALPLVLGKDIAGEPVVVDLAPMPHLLIAGTTGSGKSVGLNAMILSLLYRLTPDQCRFIMIDPKMLELSVYDGIPHLLSPVVTDPKQSITALRWAVREMEQRYQKMSAVNAKSLAGFNDKVREAKAQGKPLVRRVLTGYDDDRQPVYEEQNFNFEPLPMIVVVVDELADLMIVAGKEVEVQIQRLAQKARAAGIHLIMATQRPSVDVITGVIKANLPTRISFQVTSKIDSRTILGEQGAEQLLGKGDMLFMAAGKQPVRVHGPFVSEEEVEHVADHWRTQGQPDYVPDVTQENADGLAEDDAPIMSAWGEPENSGEDDLYRRAVQIVAESQKASTSYVQRQLRLGYNGAARLIERMEKDGLVGPADHVGRRQLFIDKEGNRL